MSKPVVVEEKGKKFTVNAPKKAKVEKVRIDGGLIRDDTSRKCDWAIKINPHEYEYIFYVELKGCDLLHAISQLEMTIKCLRSEHGSYQNKQAHAVCSRVIPAILSSAQVKAINFKKNYDFILKWHSQSGVANCV